MATNLKKDLPCPKQCYKSYLQKIKKPEEQLKFVAVRKQQVQSIINSLKSKNSSGHDSISSKALKMIVEYISQPLTVIANQPLKQC